MEAPIDVRLTAQHSAVVNSFRSDGVVSCPICAAQGSRPMKDLVAASPLTTGAHRVHAVDSHAVLDGLVHYAPLKSLWILGMTLAAVIGGVLTFSGAAFGVFLVSTGLVLLLGDPLGNHRLLVHRAFTARSGLSACCCIWVCSSACPGLWLGFAGMSCATLR